jgi:NDP-4-keto-2,6-dideoxyhexose 3-C-methyltransferase
MAYYKNIEQCRICGIKDLIEVIHIEPQHLSATFVKSNENNKLAEIMTPLTVVLCNRNIGGCGLLQLKETVEPNLLYKDYFYRSANSDTMKKDLLDVVKDVLDRVDLQEGDSVIDIGANDCTMLTYFPDNVRKIGVEPAKNIDWEGVDTSIDIVNDYFYKESLKDVIKSPVKAITACAMFYDIDNPNDFVADVKSILDPKGVFCIQLSYLPSMIKNMNFYDICSEHLEYYSLSSLKSLMERHGLSVFDASTNDVNGGSARVFICHSENNRGESEDLKNLLQEEVQMDLYNPLTYKNFYNKVLTLRNKVNGYIKEELGKGKLVIGLGASTKGNVLLQLFGIGKDILPYISERNSQKVGHRTLGTDIELISEERARKMKPSCMFVLPWYFKEEIVKREEEYLASGGKLLFPMPYPHVVIAEDKEVRL